MKTRSVIVITIVWAMVAARERVVASTNVF